MSEYENQPIPASARRNTFSIAAIWIAYPLVITPGVVGALLVLGMGFTRALWAILIGNLIQLVYVGLLGMLGAKQGINFAMQAEITYGQQGAKIISMLLATTLLGWVSVQNGIIGQFMVEGFHYSYWPLALIAGFFILLITYFGIKGLFWISLISTPLYIIAASIILYDFSLYADWSRIFNFPAPTQTSDWISMGMGISLTVANFVDGGTVNADYCRWAKKPINAWVATFCAFPCANTIAMLMGGILVAAYATPGSSVFHNINMFTFFLQKDSYLFAVFAVIFLFCNMGSVCAHTLYNSAISWSHLTHKHFRWVVITLGILSTLVAVSGIWHYLNDWLEILGIAIPPIGAVIIADQLIMVKTISSQKSRFRYLSFISILIGILIATLVNYYFKGELTALVGMVTAFIANLLLAKYSDKFCHKSRIDTVNSQGR